MPSLLQNAYNSKAKAGSGDQGSTQVKATFQSATTPGSSITAIVTTAGGLGITHSLTAGWTKQFDLSVRDLQMSVWTRENAPSTTSITASADAYRGMTLRLLEHNGVAQASAVDRKTSSSGESGTASTGSTATTSRPDEVVIGVLASQYASTGQSSFTGGMTKLFEDVTPDGGTQDWERSRTTVHQLITSGTGQFSLSGQLSTQRRWIGVLITFKGSTTGPAKFTSTQQPPQLLSGGRGALTVFGPLRSVLQPAQALIGIGVRARLGPFNDQYRLGGPSGLLIGAGTDYRVESVEGLEGFEVRISDADQPREAGSQRGVDLQVARLIVFKVNFDGSGYPDPRSRVGDLKRALLRALVPQRDADWELIFRLPGEPLRSVWCRPTSMLPSMDPDQAILYDKPFALRAADPRHYAAAVSNLTVPITANRSSPVLATAYNLGDDWAYPVIRITGPTSGLSATRMVLTNTSTGEVFDAAAVLQPGSQLAADMPSLIRALPVDYVTIDGAGKYGAWQPPRTPFRLQPGANELMFEVEPSSATPSCALEWRSTWSG